MSSKRTTQSANPKWSLKLDDQVCFALHSTVLAMNKVYRSLLRELKLTYPQYLVLLVLWEKDGIAVSEIGSRLFLDSTTLTPLLKRMEKMGLLRRQRSREDERQVLITLTSKGRGLQPKAAEIPFQVFCSSGLAVEDLTALRSQLHRLRGMLFQDLVAALPLQSA